MQRDPRCLPRGCVDRGKRPLYGVRCASTILPPGLMPSSSWLSLSFTELKNLYLANPGTPAPFHNAFQLTGGPVTRLFPSCTEVSNALPKTSPAIPQPTLLPELCTDFFPPRSLPSILVATADEPICEDDGHDDAVDGGDVVHVCWDGSVSGSLVRRLCGR